MAESEKDVENTKKRRAFVFLYLARITTDRGLINTQFQCYERSLQMQSQMCQGTFDNAMGKTIDNSIDLFPATPDY